MLIAIDASRAINETAGIGRYTRNLVKKMIEIDQKNQYLLIFSFWRPSPQKEKLIKTFGQSNVKIKILKIPGGLKEKVWQWRLPWYEKFLAGADVFFAPSFFEVNFGLKIPQVATIHDLSTFIFPAHRGKNISQRLSRRAQAAVKIAQKIICVSASTAQDAVRYLNVNPRKIKVIYPGITDFPSAVKNLPSSLQSKSYILFVGTLEPRKNLVGLFKAYALLPPYLQEKFPLVIVGAEGWNTGETFAVFRALKLAHKVKFLGYVADAVLAKLYQEAAVFVYPSLYEGFGLPVLEALSFGTPVVTANISSLPEVAGKAALLVDPNDPQSIANGLQRLLEHQEEREKLAILGPQQAAKFSWEKSSRQTLKVLEEVGRN